MRIACIGGLNRAEAQLTVIAERSGYWLEFHTGQVGGQGSSQLRGAIQRADFVVILTDVNSHGAVLLAKKLCRQAGRPYTLLRRCGNARFQALLADLAAPIRKTGS